MNRRLLPLILAAAGLCSHAMAWADSVISFNEIHYNPAGLSEAGEYVELFNQMGIKTDISGWTGNSRTVVMVTTARHSQ